MFSDRIQKWYQANHRQLPWRASRNPYHIWISETMLQQTTTQAVLPYFENFIRKFPTLKDLANAPEASVLEAWAGLGYYSRARNLRLAAEQMAKNGMPTTFSELIEHPGLGPYTARAVSSIAFGERVGVLDGNVIRVLARYLGLEVEWWKSKERQALQSLADQVAQVGEPAIANQAIMELGALVCTPRGPACAACPVASECMAVKTQSVEKLPFKRPKAERLTLLWTPFVSWQKGRLALVQNHYAPFLRGQWLFPGQCEERKAKPKQYRFSHFITRYDIYVSPRLILPKHLQQLSSLRWIDGNELKRINPSSLLQKVKIAAPEEMDLHA